MNIFRYLRVFNFDLKTVQNALNNFFRNIEIFCRVVKIGTDDQTSFSIIYQAPDIIFTIAVNKKNTDMLYVYLRTYSIQNLNLIMKIPDNIDNITEMRIVPL